MSTATGSKRSGQGPWPVVNQQNHRDVGETILEVAIEYDLIDRNPAQGRRRRLSRLTSPHWDTGRPMSEENVEAVRRGFELWNASLSDPDRARWEEAVRTMTSAHDPEATIDFSRTTPDLASAKGPDAMLDWMRGTRGLFDDVQIEPTEFVDSGDAVVVATRITATGSTSRAPVAFEYAYVFRCNSAGKVISATSYTTMGDALEAVGLAE
jgi:ketosteroid isomerase-like protein